MEAADDDEDEVEKKERKKSKKEKKDKDPNKPKRPPTAYLLWMSENREALKEKFPGLVMTELSKKGGELWKELSVDEKEVFYNSIR